MTTDAMRIDSWINQGNIMRSTDRDAIVARARTIRAAVLRELLAAGWRAARRAAGAAIHRSGPRLSGAA